MGSFKLSPPPIKKSMWRLLAGQRFCKKPYQLPGSQVCSYVVALFHGHWVLLMLTMWAKRFYVFSWNTSYQQNHYCCMHIFLFMLLPLSPTIHMILWHHLESKIPVWDPYQHVCVWVCTTLYQKLKWCLQWRSVCTYYFMRRGNHSKCVICASLFTC